MENLPGLREIPSDDRDWWTSLEEEYWQALLAHGEIAPQTVPPAPPQETFHLLGLESGIQIPAANSARKQGNGPDREAQWQVARQALERGERFDLKVSDFNRGGLLVEWNGLQGFVPASHLVEAPRYLGTQNRMAHLAERVGDVLTVALIEVSAEQERLVFSERAAQAGSDPAAPGWARLRPGDVCRGTITNLTTFGAFVDLGGVEGLVHISEISWDRVRHPADLLQPGQEVDVYVVGVNPQERRIALSLKRLRPDPWAEVESRYRVGEIIEGTVTNVVSFGAFVRVAEGLEGLIHISELAEGNFLHPRSVVREGDRVRVRVLNINKENHRLGLSLRQARSLTPTGSDERSGYGSPA